MEPIRHFALREDRDGLFPIETGRWREFESAAANQVATVRTLQSSAGGQGCHKAIKLVEHPINDGQGR